MLPPLNLKQENFQLKESP